MKCVKVLLSVLFVASALTLSVGCGGDSATTELESTGNEPPPSDTHEAEAAQINKKPVD